MSDILAFPFRITPNGRAATIPQGGDEAAAQIVTVASSTLLGERPMQHMFGIPDPAFTGLDAADLQITLQDHGFTEITIEELLTHHPTETTMRAEVHWSRDPEAEAERL